MSLGVWGIDSILESPLPQVTIRGIVGFTAKLASIFCLQGCPLVATRGYCVGRPSYEGFPTDLTSHIMPFFNLILNFF